MSKKFPDPKILADDPFRNDKLDREEFAEFLTSYIKTLEDSYVLSLTGPWGTGKTTFVKMWRQHLKNDGFTTLYYNAWQNDFVDDPLVAFISALTNSIELRGGGEKDDKRETELANVIEAANKVAWRTLPAVIRFASGGILRTEDFFGDEADADLSNLIAKVGKEAIQQYQDLKSDVEEFRSALRDLVSAVQAEDGESTVIVFVDELDRCKPDHAVLLLERIKHFFDVEGLVFILAMEPNTLAHSVRALYGAGMDAEGYLRRFIDLDFALPEVRQANLCKALIEHHRLGFNDELSHMVYGISEFESVSGRGLKKILRRLRVVLDVIGQPSLRERDLFYTIAPFLTYLKVIQPRVFNNLITHNEDSAYYDHALWPVIDGLDQGLQVILVGAVEYWIVSYGRDGKELPVFKGFRESNPRTEDSAFINRNVALQQLQDSGASSVLHKIFRTVDLASKASQSTVW